MKEASMKTIIFLISISFLFWGLVYSQTSSFIDNTSGAKMVFIGETLYSDQVIVKFKDHLI